jgi:hypothetical protein
MLISARQHETSPPLAALRLPDHLIVVSLFLLALLPRLLAPGDFWTADEAKHWSVRVDTFLPAIQEGDYAATNLVGHPGVTTMWLGSLGVLLYDGLAGLGVVGPDDPALTRMFLRVPIALVTALSAALFYPLLRRLFDWRIALLTTLLCIGDPFLVAHSKVLHVDALLTSFIMLALLAALVAVQGPGIRWGMLAASGAAGGMALLTKSPSLILFPMLGLIVVVGVFLPYVRGDDLPRSPWAALRLAVGALAAWGAVAALVWVALWPAAWVDPVGSAMTVLNEIFRNGAVPHGWGNYFMGVPNPAPGPRYYGVAIALRITPWTMLGLFATGGVALRRLWTQRGETRRGLSAVVARMHPPLLLLLIFALVFIGVMSALAKKFDRYVLPTFPVLQLVAALGLIWLYDGVRHWHAQRNPPASNGTARAGASPPALALWAVLVLAMAGNLAWYHPYELAYFNQALGGGPVAQRSIIVGWGEGFEQAAAYIREQENGCDLGVASWYEDVILPYTCSPVLHQGYVTVPGHVHYAVLYINQVQRQIRMDEMGAFLRERGSLVHTVTIHGIDYAYVYQLRQPRQHELTDERTTMFGSAMQLTGYDADTSAIQSTGMVTLTLQWHVAQEMDSDYMMFIHLFDDAGNPIGQLDAPPGGLLPTSTWGHNRFIDWVHRVPVDPTTDAEWLWMSLGIYDPHDFSRLPLHAPSPGPAAPDDGANALLLALPVE